MIRQSARHWDLFFKVLLCADEILWQICGMLGRNQGKIALVLALAGGAML